MMLGVRYEKENNGKEYTIYALQMTNDRDKSIQVFTWSQDDRDGEDIATFIQYLYYDLYDYSFADY